MKRLLSLLISALLLTGTSGMVAAYDEYEDDYYDDYYYEISYEPFEYEIVVDNDLRTSDTGYLVDYWEHYRYTTVSEALGFKTTFNESTGMVESVKDDTKISFWPDGSYMYVAKGNEIINEMEWPYGIANVEDRVYIEYSQVEYFFGDYTKSEIFVDLSNYSLNIVTPEKKQSLTEEADRKLTYINELLNAVKDKNYISESAYVVNISLASEFFGVSATGDTEVEILSVKEDDKVYTKISQSNDGLMNFFRLINDEDISISPITETFTDGGITYYKGKDTVKSMLDYEYYGFAEEYEDEAQEVLDKWCYNESDVYSSVPFITKDMTVGEFIVNYAFDTSGSGAFEIIDTLTSLLSDENFVVSKSGGTKTYRFKIDTDTFLKAFETSEAFSEDLSTFDDLSISLTLTEKVSASGASSVGNGKIILSNIPNPWNEKVFSSEITFSSKENTKFKENTGFDFPDVSNAVNLTEFAQETIDNDIFYDFYE